MFQCTLCPKRFTRAYNLRSHLRTHTDERPFVCSVCGKAFARQHDRRRHEGLHSGMLEADVRGPQTSSESSIAGGESSEQKTSNIEAQNEDALHVYIKPTSMDEQTLKDHPAELEESGSEVEAVRREELIRRMRELKYIKDSQLREDEEELIRRMRELNYIIEPPRARRRVGALQASTRETSHGSGAHERKGGAGS